MKKTLLIYSLALLFFQGKALGAEKALRVSYPSPATVYLPLWAAKEAGFFAKHKLNVELIHVGSSPISLSAFLAGEIDILGGGGSAGPNAYLQGSRDLKFFASMNSKFVFSIYSHPSISSAAELRGKKIGVTRLGGTMHFATRYYLKSIGLDPYKDVTLVQVGRAEDIVTALAGGTVDAGTMSFPFDLKTKELGYRELADLSRSGARYASSSFIGQKQFLLDNRPRMESFIKALIEALHFVNTRRQDGIKILARYTRLSDMNMLKRTYDFHAENIWPRVPEIQPEDLKLVLEELAERNPRAREIAAADLIYGQIVQDVVKSGFVQQLYR